MKWKGLIVNDIEKLATSCGSVSDDRYDDRTVCEFDKTALKQFAEAYAKQQQSKASLQQEQEKDNAFKDEVMYGQSFMRDGKHIPLDDVLQRQEQEPVDIKKLNPIDILYLAEKCNADKTFFDHELISLTFSTAKLDDYAYLIQDFFLDQFTTPPDQFKLIESQAREIAELKAALHEINSLRGSTLNFGVARAIACKALGIKHTDSSELPSTESCKSPIDEMVNKFLGWKLPENFTPDAGIAFKPFDHQRYNSPHWPIGTNLLTADQAKAMLKYVAFDTITELQSHINVLREDLLTISVTMPQVVLPPRPNMEVNLEYFNEAKQNYQIMAQKALQSTPAQSLARHDDETIERCANVVEEVSNNAYCVLAVDKIRALKGTS